MPTTTFPPILVWQPGGGTPVGPVSTPPVYSQADITQLVIGQAYVDVVFGSVQTDNNWVLVTCEVENSTDLDPLNIWPGIITSRTPAGFRLQLNGMPDSGNYYLHWAVSGINIQPVQATLYLFTGPTSAPFGVNSPFTVKLPPSTTLSVPITITPNDGGAGGTFSPSTVTLSNGSASATFVYNAVAYGAATISVTNSGTLIDPASIVFTSIAPTYTFSGPTGGVSGVASTNFTVLLAGDAVLAVPTTITPHDGGASGTFTPTTVLLVAGVPVHFTYTPASAGTKTISVTNDGGLANPANLTYTVTAPFAPTDIAGCKLWLKADSLALTDGTAVSAWADSSGSGFNFAQPTGAKQPIFKTAIVNGKPVVRFDGVDDWMSNNAGAISSSTNYTIFVVCSPASLSAGSHDFFCNGVAAVTFGILLRRNAADLSHILFDGGGPVTAQETGAFTAGAWNVISANWDGANMHLWRNGALKATTAIAIRAGGGPLNVIGSYDQGVAEIWDGDMAEVLIYNSALSTTDRQAVELYLKTKYATP